MATREELAEQIFLTVRALEPVDRESVLEQMCAHDSKLKQLVEDRLAEDEEMGSFLENPPLEFFRGAMSETATVTSSREDAARPSQGRLAAGHVLNDRFVIVRFIAKGGMGEVYEAEDTLLHGPHIALKTILPEDAGNPDLQHRFEQEVLSAREVVHPNLCPIYGIERSVEPAPGFLFMTMKLLPGETLAARLRRWERVQKDEGVAIVRQMAAGLAAIHAEGIVHRDIKTNNVMVERSGGGVRLWITDFGLARALEAELTVSGARVVLAGTPNYIAPELHKGQPPSRASDLYAFGVVLHEVFTGEKPVAKEDGSGVIFSSRLSSSAAPSSCVELIEGCLDDDPRKRCEAFDRYVHGRSNRWTRRAFIGSAAAVACSAAIGGWRERDRFEDLWHPLPGKRFVALLNWPNVSDDRVTPMLTGVLNAIKGELTRLEAFDRRLFVISPEDAHLEVKPDAHLKEVCDPLGANLALIAQGVPGGKYFELILRLLDPITNRIVRQREVKCLVGEVTSLPGKAVQAAKRMLDLAQYLKSTEGADPGTQSTAAFIAFQDAETLMKKPNDQGLEAAVEKYKDALESDPRYALAYAKLSIAYCHLFRLRHEPGVIELARRNGERALALQPDLAEGHLARSAVLQDTGDEQGALDELAKVRATDPLKPRALLWQAQIYTRLNRWSDAEEIFNRVLKERPNNWVLYNELGNVLHQQGKTQGAIEAFHNACAAAPKVALPLNNLGAEYLDSGDVGTAIETFKKSLALAPDFDLPAINLAVALRTVGKNEEALSYAQKAVQSNPGNDENWLELGDCYASLHNRQSDARSAFLRAAAETEQYLKTDPTNGPSWMLLALYRVKSGNSAGALGLIQKAEKLGAADMDSQIYKARALEMLGRRDQALNALAECFKKNPKSVDLRPFPEMQALRQDARYKNILSSKVD
jgi:tetratricopeptide (TPR) repeat protein